MAKKYVYFFGAGKAEGNSRMRNLLGGKGCDLAEMTNLKIPVPAGFTITTEVCTAYYANKKKYPPGLKEQVQKALPRLEKAMGAKFGDPKNPLLLSVRSGARVSMPGMMDTILNLGLNERTILGLIEKSGDERFAYDSYRRFIQMYSDVVLGVSRDKMEERIAGRKQQKGAKLDLELSAQDWRELVAEFKEIVKKETGKDFPEDPPKQLWGAIGAVFESWDTPRAVTYRQLNKIPSDWGTAVNVQAMVFGNMVVRDPATIAATLWRDHARGRDDATAVVLREAR